MSDKMRWRYGDTNPVVAAVDADEVIEIGDLVWLDADDAKAASQLAAQGSTELNQEALAGAFLGVAMQRSRSGDTTPVRVATTGVFELECAAATFELGDLVGAAPDDDVLCDQKVVAVASAAYALGRVARREPAAAANVLVDIRSTIMTGGVAGTSAGA